MSNRIDTTFQTLAESGRAGFVAYISAGDPHMDATCDLALGMAEAGVDVLELGIPFSDPLADGIVNQMAAQRALEAGSTVIKVFEAVRAIRRHSQIPIVFYTYLNPVYQYGPARFMKDAAEAGADGILMLDLPPDEIASNPDLACSEALAPIRLVAPTTPPERLPGIVASARGFIYYVSREGVTGEHATLSSGIEAGVQAIKAHTKLPVAVGFGISNPDHARTVAAAADAVVVGTAIVRRVEEFGASPDLVRQVCDFVRPLVEATHAVKKPTFIPAGTI